MKKFLLILVIVYIAYYGFNILWDGFLKKAPKQDDNEGDEMVFEEEQPQRVTMDNIESVPEPESDGSRGGRQLEMSVQEANIIDGRIEDQGIEANSFIKGFKQAAEESKGMFAGVVFN